MKMTSTLRTFLLVAGAMVCVAAGMMAQGKINPTDPQPTCNMCPGTYIPLSELEAYTKKAIAERLVDQQVRDIDLGKAHVGIGMVYRGKLEKPAPDSVAEHDQVSEVYHIISGSATLMLGPDIVNRVRELGGNIFLDLKFHDIPNTVAKAVSAATRLGIQMLTGLKPGSRLLAPNEQLSVNGAQGMFVTRIGVGVSSARCLAACRLSRSSSALSPPRFIGWSPRVPPSAPLARPSSSPPRPA